MAEYKAPIDDMKFIANEVFKTSELWSTLPLYSEVDQDTADAILEESARINQDMVSPNFRSADEEGCHFNDGEVTTPKGYKEAYNALMEGGWIGLGGNPEFGGMGMPKTLSVFFEEMISAADNSFSLYSCLTAGAALLLDSHASEEIKSYYLPKMYSGEWGGTMCLTEPHAGTDLGIIRTKADPQADGSYSITGTKIFISSGEHDLTENIIHLVLAKLPDAPEGSRGISLFLVPKFHSDEGYELGERNGVSCGSIEHKMGIKGSATCVMNFDSAKGYLIGEVNKGLPAMFTMMNYERISTGLQGIGCAQRSYQHACEYALERLQSRAATGAENADAKADPIIVHADVRRMLMNMRSLVEGGRALMVYVASQLDTAKASEDAEAKAYAQSMVELLTPVAKAFFSDMGLEVTVTGQQVFGGHGYVREWGMEQLVRDVRIVQIYEGTNGIQAMDLIGRKVLRDGGKNMALFLKEVRDYIDDAGLEDELTNPLSAAISRLERFTEIALERGKESPNAPGSMAVDYLHVTGYVCYGYMWLKMAEAAKAALEAGAQNTAFYEAKLATARYYMERVLPRVESLVSMGVSDENLLYALDESVFAS
ncbi:MAG: acyl-CoA dehydrogenase C-terminal domain-containing protein [Pseudomonadota bacterium]|nr:acyl-CoA dehydrogenase C-terminal domain-containing protein [Pseudomonadota bacterium]